MNLYFGDVSCLNNQVLHINMAFLKNSPVTCYNIKEGMKL